MNRNHGMTRSLKVYGIDNTKYIINDNIDYYFIGESELNFVEFIKKLKDGTSVDNIPGLCRFRQKTLINKKTTAPINKTNTISLL